MAKLTKFQPGRGYSKADWDTVSDNPESTAEELAQARPFAEVFPELAVKMRAEAERRKAGRPKADVVKKTISLRVDPDVLDAFKATGPGWQTRMNDALRAWVKRKRRAA